MNKLNTTNAIEQIADNIINQVENQIHEMVATYINETIGLGYDEASTIAHAMLIPLSKYDQIHHLKRELEIQLDDDQVEEIFEHLGEDKEGMYECSECGDCGLDEDDNCPSCEDYEEEEE